MAQFTTFRLSSKTISAGVGDFSGLVSEILVDQSLAGGTGTNQADVIAFDSRTLSATTAEDIDLKLLTFTPDGAAAALVEVRILVIQSASANGSNIEVKPGAANGWTPLLKDASDILQIAPGATAAFFAPVDGSYAVGAADKIININNLDGNSATYTIYIVGASA